MKQSNKIKLKDYQEYPFNINSIDLEFIINKDHVLVKNKMYFEAKIEGIKSIELKGKELELVSLLMNGREIPKTS